MAVGSHTVAVTQGAVATFNSEELKGVIAHEIAHIYYGDTKAVIINTIGNGIFSILVFIVKLFLKAMELIAKKMESPVLQAVFNLFRFIFELFTFGLLWVGDFILSFNSRGNELKADKFAFKIGYGEELTASLYIMQKISLGGKMKLVTRMLASHPRVSKRIGRLEALTDAEE